MLRVGCPERMRIDWNQYQPSGFYDELFAAPGTARPSAAELAEYLASLGIRALAERQADAERAIVEMGITFTVYTEGQNIDRAWPFDVIPRTIEAAEWARIERGLIQRLKALNHFIDDLYHDRRIIRDGVVPDDIIATSANFLPACIVMTASVGPFQPCLEEGGDCGAASRGAAAPEGLTPLFVRNILRDVFLDG